MATAATETKSVYSKNIMDADAVADSNSFDVSGTSVALLQGFLNTTAVVSIDEAIEILRNYCPQCSLQVALDTLVANKWEVAQITIVGFSNEHYKCAIRIFTAEEPFPFYKWTNAPFFSKRRSQFSLRFHGPYVKLLLLAVQELMSLPSFAYEGVGYRGLKLDGNAELKRKYLDHKNEFVVGQLMTFPAFMSVSTDDSVADDFGDYVFFVFIKVRGARIARLSQLPKEAEILVPPPSVFRIKAVAKVGTTKSFVGGHEVKSGGRLTITLEQESCPLTYLSQSASSALPTDVSVPPAAGTEDPKVLALSKALEALDVGSTASCLKFSKALEEQGILTMDRLKKLPEADAREALEAAGMKKLQVRSVMEAITPPPTVSPMSPAPAPKPILSTPSVSIPEAKKAPSGLNPLAPHVFGIPIARSREFEIMLPLRVSGQNLNSEGLGFLSKFLSESILTCHQSYGYYPYSEVQIVSCTSLFNAQRLQTFESLPGDCFMAIHGTTSISNVASISAKGFRPSPAGCFGRGIYLAQNSSVALVHTIPKDHSVSIEKHMPGHHNLILCFVKTTGHQEVIFPPKPAMEMVYNGFPSTSDQLSNRDVLIGEMPHRFREAVVNDPNRVYAAWHVQVRVVEGTAVWERCWKTERFGYANFNLGAVRLPNGAPALCQTFELLFKSNQLVVTSPLTRLQWAVLNRDFVECALLLRSGAKVFFEQPDFPLHELAQPLPLYTLPTIPECKSGRSIHCELHDFWEQWSRRHLTVASLGLGGVAQLEFQRKCSELIMKSKPASIDDARGMQGGIYQYIPYMRYFEPFSDLLPVIKRICASPSKDFDKAAEAELTKIQSARGIVRHGAYLYRTLGFRFFDSDHITNTCPLLDIPAGWAIALGDADDRRVASLHPWQSECLVFANGESCATRGSRFHPNDSISLERDGAKFGLRMRATYYKGDVLLFKGT